jgi:hypothetical protein
MKEVIDCIAYSLKTSYPSLTDYRQDTDKGVRARLILISKGKAVYEIEHPE